MALAVALAAGFWPVWRWYVARMSDGSDEPLGLLALAAAMVFLPRRGWLNISSLGPQRIAGAGMTLLTYLALFDHLPALIRAALAVGAIALVLPRDRERPMLPLLALLLLSLPLIATMQYVLGFPVRAATAWCSAHILRLAGFAIEARGTVLQWAGEEVLIDAPCSGIRMLWTAATLSAVLACIHRLPTWRFLRLAQTAGVAVFLGNIGRSCVLFLTETGQWPNPTWAHEATGLVVFGVILGVCTCIAGRLAASRCRPVSVGPLWAPKGRSAMAQAFVGGLIISLAVMAGLRPIASRSATVAHFNASVESARGWPGEFEGMALQPAALHPLEARFGAEFPGAFAAFTDGQRRIVFRHIEIATRKVHPAAGCLRAAGYSVEPLSARRMAESGLWAVVRAEKDGRRLLVREQIRGASADDCWTDVSAWYWSALLRPSRGPWLAVTVIDAAEE